MREVDAAPPYHRSSRAKEFVGLKVQWRAKLSAVHPRDGGSVYLILWEAVGGDPALEPIGGNQISAYVDPGDYPWLRAAPAGTPVWIAGTIADAEYSIRLDGAILQGP